MTDASDKTEVEPQKRAMTATDTDGKRVYVHPVTGEKFRSVTSILSAAAKPALEKWKIKTISTFAAENREKLAAMDEESAADLVRSSQWSSANTAATTGELVHSRVEELMIQLQGFQTSVSEDASYHRLREWMFENPAPEENLRHVDQTVVEFLDEFEIRPLHMEATLVNRTVGYAGSADLIAEVKPRGEGQWKRAVLDVKSGKSLHGSAAAQMVAYAKAEVILQGDGTEIPMPPIQATFGWHIRPKSWAIKPMRYDREVWETFQALVTVDRWVNFEERRAVGSPLNRAAIERQRSFNTAYTTEVQDAA